MICLPGQGGSGRLPSAALTFRLPRPAYLGLPAHRKPEGQRRQDFETNGRGASDKRPAGARKHPAGRRPCFGSGLADEVALALPSPFGVGVRQRPSHKLRQFGSLKRLAQTARFAIALGFPGRATLTFKPKTFGILSYLEGRNIQDIILS